MIEGHFLTFGPLLAQIMLSALVTWFFGRGAKRLEKKQIARRAALPIPFFIWLFCAYIFIDASTASPEECGVDACGIAIAGAMMFAMMGLILYLIGLGTSLLTNRVMQRKSG